MHPTPQLLLFAEFMLKSTAVLALALLASRLWRGTSAANRHLIWLAAFAVLLLAPLTRTFTPRWVWQPAPADTPVASLPASPQVFESTARLPTATKTVARATSAPVASASPGKSRWIARLAPRNWLLLVWFAGAAALLARLAMGAGQLWWWQRRSSPLSDARANALCRRIAADYRLVRPVELRSLASCRVPMTWGTRRPVVLLPTDADTWPEHRLAIVLRHELGHIARRDCLARLLAQFVSALYWPNPLVWHGARALRLTQEQACDDLVLAAGAPPETYALELVAAARHLHGSRWAVPAASMAEPSTLSRRIESIIGEPRDRRPLMPRTVTLAAAVVPLALVGFALAQVRGAEETKPAKPSPNTLVIDPGAVVTPADAVTAKKLQGIYLETTFIEINERDLKDLDLDQYGAAVPSSGISSFDLMGGKAPRLIWVGTLDKEAALRALRQKSDIKILSSPSCTFYAGCPSILVVAEEFRYPRSFSATGKPHEFTTRNLGTELMTTPTVAPDGHTISLELHPRVTELEGLVAYGDEGDKSTVLLKGTLIDRLPATAEFPSGAFQPVFSVREAKGKVTLQDGATLVLGGIEREVQLGEAPAPEAIQTAIEKLTGRTTGSDQTSAPDLKRSGKEKRMILVFVTAKTKLIPAPVPKPTKPYRIVLDSKKVEISGNGFRMEGLNLPPPKITGRASSKGDPAFVHEKPIALNEWYHILVNDQAIQAVMRTLAQNPDAKILALPSVTVFSGERSNIAKDLRYPSNYGTPRGPESKVTSATGTPQEFETDKIGVELNVVPTVEGRDIDLILYKRITEYEGFVDVSGQSVPNRSVKPTGTVTEASAYQPIFSALETTSRVLIQDGDTLVFGGLTGRVPRQITDQVSEQGDLVDNEDGTTQRTVLFFVTARILKEDEAPDK